MTRTAPRAPFTLLACLALTSCADAEPRTRPPAAPQSSCADRARADSSLQAPVWELDVALERWDALHADPLADVEVDATLCVEGRAYPIELELQGASSRGALKKSFKLKLNRGARLDRLVFGVGGEGDGAGFGELVLKAMAQDHSLIREALAFDLWRAMGHDAPRVAFANLRINGAYWGLYAVVEPVDEDYLARRGYPPGGRLYKATREHGSWADFAPGRDLGLAFENKTDAAPPPFADLEALVRTLQDTPLEQAAFLREIDPIFPLDAYFERMIWVAFTQNGDATAQNFFLYNAKADGHDFWYQLPWDSNLCFGADWRDRDDVHAPDGSLLIDGRNHFGRRLLKVDELRTRYVERFRAVMDRVLTDQLVTDSYQRHARAIERDLARDQLRWQRTVSPSQAFAVLEDFMHRRPDVLRAALDALPHGGAVLTPRDDAGESEREDDEDEESEEAIADAGRSHE
jgi:spore coat protein H